MDEELRREIEGLRKLKMKELKARYHELFGEASPSSNRAHLFRRVAWRLQARAEGGLSERARERAAQLADDADLRLRMRLAMSRTASRGVQCSPASSLFSSLKRRTSSSTIE